MTKRLAWFLVAMMTLAPAAPRAATEGAVRSRISVTGDAVVNVVPDQIVIGLGIETSDPDIQVAKRTNDEILARTLAAVKAGGVPEKSIQTDHLSIEPRWRDDYRNDGFLGYFVRNTLVVTLSDPAKVDDLVTRVLLAGVTHIHGVDFQASAYKTYREQARERALRAAREKAEKMAAVLGRAVGAPLEIGEGGWGWPSRVYSSWSGWGSGRGQGMAQNAVQNAPGGGSETPESIALGRIGIHASVTVTFELVDR